MASWETKEGFPPERQALKPQHTRMSHSAVAELHVLKQEADLEATTERRYAVTPPLPRPSAPRLLHSFGERESSQSGSEPKNEPSL